MNLATPLGPTREALLYDDSSEKARTDEFRKSTRLDDDDGLGDYLNCDSVSGRALNVTEALRGMEEEHEEEADAADERERNQQRRSLRQMI